MAGKKRRQTGKYDRNVYRSLTLITQFGINMLVPIFLCFFAGYYLDKKLGTSYWMILLFFVGALAGFRNIYVFSRRIFSGGSHAGRSRGEKAESRENKDDKKAAHTE